MGVNELSRSESAERARFLPLSWKTEKGSRMSQITTGTEPKPPPPIVEDNPPLGAVESRAFLAHARDGFECRRLRLDSGFHFQGRTGTVIGSLPTRRN